jgi:N-acetylglucosaminyldiphosphoundecaprenol N-acetyl-beta-D-mannosaminyltransferase
VGKKQKKNIQIASVKLTSLPRTQLLKAFDTFIHLHQKGYVCFCEANLCVRASRDAELTDILDNAAFVLPDGVAMTAGARLLGEEFAERQPGPEIMLDFIEYGLKKNYRHFFYGGTTTSLIKLQYKLQEKFPTINIAGAYSPPFKELTEKESDDICQQINRSEADVVWVGLGAPKQERWMHRFSPKLTTHLLLGVGAAFDFHSGVRKRAPRFIQNLGLEWLFRMVTGGPRIFMRNLLQETKFVLLILSIKIFKKKISFKKGNNEK